MQIPPPDKSGVKGVVQLDYKDHHVTSTKDKTDAELLSELESTRSLLTFLSDNDVFFMKKSIGELLHDKIEEHNISKSAVAKGAGMNYIYLYQILAGLRKPSRNRVICIGLGMGCGFEEMQDLLRDCGYAELNISSRRDAIIMYGILHGQDVFTINDNLYNDNEENLF